MNAIGLPGILVLILLFAAVVIISAVTCTVLFLTFRRIPPAYRALDPGLVWLLMIPCFAFFWNFFVFNRLSRSLQDAYRAAGRADVGDCGAGVGLAYDICAIGAFVPILGCLAAPAALVLLVIYLVKVDGLSRQIPGEGEMPAVIPAPRGGLTAPVIVIIAVAAAIFAVPMLGVIAAIAIPNFLTAIDRSKQKRTMADIETIGLALEAYRLDRDSYPVAGDIETLRRQLEPKYLTSVPAADGWGHPFGTEARPDGYTIVSYGKDGIPDGCAPRETRDLNDDICYSAGGFTRYPAGAFRPPPPAAPPPAPPGGS